MAILLYFYMDFQIYIQFCILIKHVENLKIKNSHLKSSFLWTIILGLGGSKKNNPAELTMPLKVNINIYEYWVSYVTNTPLKIENCKIKKKD